MIREDRIALNERFIRVFDLLKARGEIVLNDRNGRGIGDFAEKILGNRGYGHIIRAFLNSDDRRVIDYRHARNLCREYGVNEAYMLDGIGDPFGMPAPSGEQLQPGSSGGNILFTTASALAGFGVENQNKEDLTYFSMPGLEGSGLVAFPIEGNSMEPVILDGDVIICRELAGVHEIRENDIYVVNNNGSLWVKYVEPVQSPKGRIERLKLRSANFLEHDPFEEDVNTYTRIFRVIRRIASVN